MLTAMTELLTPSVTICQASSLHWVFAASALEELRSPLYPTFPLTNNSVPTPRSATSNRSTSDSWPNPSTSPSLPLPLMQTRSGSGAREVILQARASPPRSSTEVSISTTLPFVHFYDGDSAYQKPRASA